MKMVSRAVLILCLCAPALAGAAPSAGTTTAAPAAATSTAQLGQIEVDSIKPLVETLEQMKLAMTTPFDNDPKHYDVMVCRLKTAIDSRAGGRILECGTQGWFNMQRSIYAREMNVVTDPSMTGTPTLGHPWHSERLLNFKQLQALRAVLGKLPEPGKGDVEVVLDDAVPAATTGSPTPAPAAATQKGESQ
jgi:hypothetical protein